MDPPNLYTPTLFRRPSIGAALSHAECRSAALELPGPSEFVQGLRIEMRKVGNALLVVQFQVVNASLTVTWFSFLTSATSVFLVGHEHGTGPQAFRAPDFEAVKFFLHNLFLYELSLLSLWRIGCASSVSMRCWTSKPIC